MSASIDNVRIVKKANVYFDGKCVSHSLILADGSRQSLGVILPSTLTFNTEAPEIMEGVRGTCRVRLANQTEWKTYGPHESFSIAAHSSFDIEVTNEPYHYICHFG